jgi:DNA invertase Pin-like site-specific DNA recombinase
VKRTPKTGLQLTDKIDPAQTRLVGYARVSTEDQSLEMQQEALLKYGCHPDSIHLETGSAVAKKRYSLDLAIKELQPGDTLVVWKIDRLARNVRQLYDILDRVQAAGAQFKSLQEEFDFTTLTGKFILGILGLVAELERGMIAERTRHGMAVIKDRHLGRPIKMTDAKRKRVIAMLRKTGNMSAAAKAIKVSRQALYEWCAVERRNGKYIVTWKKD